MNAKVMAFAMSALAVVAGIYVYNEFIAKDDSVAASTDAGTDGNFAGRRRRR
tara:strand:+ start:59 stop:214 length:156 start_codon:yes stop_codon:yes gene_type:complete